MTAGPLDNGNAVTQTPKLRHRGDGSATNQLSKPNMQFKIIIYAKYLVLQKKATLRPIVVCDFNFLPIPHKHLYLLTPDFSRFCILVWFPNHSSAETLHWLWNQGCLFFSDDGYWYWIWHCHRHWLSDQRKYWLGNIHICHHLCTLVGKDPDFIGQLSNPLHQVNIFFVLRA